MRKTCLFCGLMLLCFLFSCKSTPETSPVEMPEEETVSEEVSVPEIEPSPEIDEVPIEETPSVVVPIEEPESNDFFIDLSELREPELDFPEVSIIEEPEVFQAEIPDDIMPELSFILPEQPAEELPAEVPTIPQGDESADTQISTESQPVPEEEKTEEEQLPPSPPPPPLPSFLRPAEPIEDSNIIRESIPLPVNPIPEVPARPVPSLEEENIVFSRTVRATVGQIIEIPFRGSGWVFLGELHSRRGISYNSRRLDPEGQSFIFLAEQPGTFVLKFYKEDYIRDYILNDHVQIIVGEAPEPAGTGWFNPPSNWSRVIAEPRWPPEPGSSAVQESAPQTASPQTASETTAAESSSLPAAQQSSLNESPSTAVSTEVETETANSVPVNAAPEEYMKKAQEEFDAGRIAESIAVLEQFRQYYPSGSDEAFWLLGQCYEANSPSRDIRTSLDYYRRLTDEYPQSRRYAGARARIAYLERYYLNIR